MSMNELLIFTVLFTTCVAAFTDVYEGMIIPNKIVLFGLVSGFTLQIANGNFIESFVGFIGAFGIMMIFYLLGALHAGDVKLLAVLGIYTGLSAYVVLLIYVGIAGMIILFGMFLYRNRHWATKTSIQNIINLRQFPEFSISKGKKFVPYAPAIFLGTVLYIFTLVV